MKVYITKYALTKGILVENDAEICADINPKMICISRNGFNDHYHKPHWHETWEEALAQALQMKTDKIISLQKQLVKLTKLEFKEPLNDK
jgi:hypothetical protein